jgi:hypothetical protein
MHQASYIGSCRGLGLHRHVLTSSSSWYKELSGQTSYELTNDTYYWNYRTHDLLDQLREQVDLFACSGGVWTQTTDVEGEVNGLMTYGKLLLCTGSV